MEMRKSEKPLEMVFKYHYEQLSAKVRTELRDEFLAESGLPFPTFYCKMNKNSFRPLEAALLRRLFEKYQKIEDNKPDKK